MNINDMARQAFLNSLTENLSDFEKLILQMEDLCDMAEDLCAKVNQLGEAAEAELRRLRDE